MAVLEVSVPTGYIVEQHELHGYVRAHLVRNLREARYQEGKIIFYFEYVRDVDQNSVLLVCRHYQCFLIN